MKQRMNVALKRWYSSERTKSANPLILISNNQNIHFNLSLENFLLNNYSDLLKYLNVNTIEKYDDPVLFLWRNNRSIIIGKNQNIWSECNLENIKKDNVQVARRFTGGGAVYHDLENVCFTFLNNTLNTDNNFSIILKTLKRHFSIDAKKQGRNDITVNDRKCSGSAFKKVRNVFLHHGTIMVNLEKDVLKMYLTPDKMKYIKHGVSSVNARTINLKEINQNITCQNLCCALIKEFEAFYKKGVSDTEGEGSNAATLHVEDYTCGDSGATSLGQPNGHLTANLNKREKSTDNLVDISSPISNHFNIHYIDTNESITKNPEFLKYLNLLKDWDWCYGKTPKFQNRLCRQFNFGKLEIFFNVSDGMIKDGNIFSDCLDVNLVEQLKFIFNNDVKYSKDSVSSFLRGLKVENKDPLAEVTEWILQEL
ncbi:lipoate-protein ligase A [Plasmodium inui San Antonio 1]|uniref:lipoate--protein ligase n=1 Tax=Plasmodium inui San Antonio 1 TaxID=1237626 RepID=W7A6S6_9APIC|nr:lipoate-protein ligase A [Plasmodium inui San Antonio 1]EUD68832.1 lipoate-protein ligase A [Plasmodium inui San Antonio 1]